MRMGEKAGEIVTLNEIAIAARQKFPICSIDWIPCSDAVFLFRIRKNKLRATTHENYSRKCKTMEKHISIVPKV